MSDTARTSFWYSVLLLLTSGSAMRACTCGHTSSSSWCVQQYAECTSYDNWCSVEGELLAASVASRARKAHINVVQVQPAGTRHDQAGALAAYAQLSTHLQLLERLLRLLQLGQHILVLQIEINRQQIAGR